MDDDDEQTNVSITLRSAVSGPEAGSIIGFGGENINSIRKESGAKIKIEGSSQQERVITVDGPTDSIFKAYTLICKTLEGQDNLGDGEINGIHLDLLVPSSQCGAIIGLEGMNIKEIRKTTGAMINVCGEPLPGSSERCVKVSGSREEVIQCIFHICSALLESPPKDEATLYKPDSGLNYPRNGDNRGREGRKRERYSGSTHSFEHIANFARKQSGRKQGDDSRDRDERYEMKVQNDIVGAVIGKRGAKINEIRQISGAQITIIESNLARRRDNSPPNLERERIIEICGSIEAVALAKSLISMAMDLGPQEDLSKGRGDYLERSWDRGNDKRRRRERTRSPSRDQEEHEDRMEERDKFVLI